MGIGSCSLFLRLLNLCYHHNILATTVQVVVFLFLLWHTSLLLIGLQPTTTGICDDYCDHEFDMKPKQRKTEFVVIQGGLKRVSSRSRHPFPCTYMRRNHGIFYYHPYLQESCNFPNRAGMSIPGRDTVLLKHRVICECKDAVARHAREQTNSGILKQPRIVTI